MTRAKVPFLSRLSCCRRKNRVKRMRIGAALFAELFAGVAGAVVVAPHPVLRQRTSISVATNALGGVDTGARVGDLFVAAVGHTRAAGSTMPIAPAAARPTTGVRHSWLIQEPATLQAVLRSSVHEGRTGASSVLRGATHRPAVGVGFKVSHTKVQAHVRRAIHAVIPSMQWAVGGRPSPKKRGLSPPRFLHPVLMHFHRRAH